MTINQKLFDHTINIEEGATYTDQTVENQMHNTDKAILEKLYQLQHDKEALKEENAKLHSQLETAEETIRDCCNRIDKLGAQVKIFTEAAAENTALSDVLEEKKATIKSLRVHCEEQSYLNSQLENEVKNLSEEVASASKKLQHIESSLEEKCSDLTEALQLVQRYEELISQKNDELQVKEDEIQHLIVTSSQLKTTVIDLREQHELDVQKHTLNCRCNREDGYQVVTGENFEEDSTVDEVNSSCDRDHTGLRLSINVHEKSLAEEFEEVRAYEPQWSTSLSNAFTQTQPSSEKMNSTNFATQPDGDFTDSPLNESIPASQKVVFFLRLLADKVRTLSVGYSHEAQQSNNPALQLYPVPQPMYASKLTETPTDSEEGENASVLCKEIITWSFCYCSWQNYQAHLYYNGERRRAISESQYTSKQDSGVYGHPIGTSRSNPNSVGCIMRSSVDLPMKSALGSTATMSEQRTFTLAVQCKSSQTEIPFEEGHDSEPFMQINVNCSNESEVSLPEENTTMFAERLANLISGFKSDIEQYKPNSRSNYADENQSANSTTSTDLFYLEQMTACLRFTRKLLADPNILHLAMLDILKSQLFNVMSSHKGLNPGCCSHICCDNRHSNTANSHFLGRESSLFRGSIFQQGEEKRKETVAESFRNLFNFGVEMASVDAAMIIRKCVNTGMKTLGMLFVFISLYAFCYNCISLNERQNLSQRLLSYFTVRLTYPIESPPV